MEFLHCNRCFQRNPPGGYYISSCFHIFCQVCTKSDLTHCSMCKKDVKIVRLNGNISQGIKIYFTDPLKSFTEFMEKLQRKVDFQATIRMHLIKHLTKEKEKKRQMEVYFRKKGQEFESQKKKLAEANSWIVQAERKLQASEEERLRLQRDVEELQTKLQSHCTPLVHPITPSPSAPFSFMMAESEEIARALIDEGSQNSTFNMISPMVNSPARSLNDTNYQHFFENTTIGNGLGDDTMFATVSTSNSHQRSTLSDTTAFSATFNNMFAKDVEMTMIDKTSHSLDNWRGNSMSALDMSRRDSSLPTTTPLPPRPAHSSNRIPSSNRRDHHRPPPGPMRDIRRFSSQPGYLAHRKSMQNRSGSSGNGSGGASFIEENGLF